MKITIKEVESQGRISIPKKWRDELGLKPKSKVEMIFEGREIVMIPIRKKSLMDFRGSVKPKRKIKDLEKEIEESMTEETVKDLEISGR